MMAKFNVFNEITFLNCFGIHLIRLQYTKKVNISLLLKIEKTEKTLKIKINLITKVTQNENMSAIISKEYYNCRTFELQLMCNMAPANNSH